MNANTQIDASSTEAMEAIVRRARSLYSLPAIAAEVIELTSSPRVDARALKDCIEVDPALTAKILRVVNSSLFGLSREVSDLNQAIALLGTKPLKLLVLGFSLPENLFRTVAQEQLDWYWRTTLARAVAAREISEQLWKRSGDDAFLAGLLQDIGILVLLGDFKEPYSQLLKSVIDQSADLRRLEIDSFGFDHATLSAVLLEHWNMPEQLVRAVAEPRRCQSLRHKQTAEAELARILHIAELLAELVAQGRLSVLADLLEAGEAYCGLDKAMLNSLVSTLQPKVQQLAEVLSLDVLDDTDYVTIIEKAHAQMSGLAEGLAAPLSRLAASEDQLGADLLSDVTLLRNAVDRFLKLPPSETPEIATLTGSTCPGAALQSEKSRHNPATESCSPNDHAFQIDASFTGQLTLAVGRSRSLRQPLSVLMLAVGVDSNESASYEKRASQMLDAACRASVKQGMILEAVSSRQRAIVLPGFDRQEAYRYANSIIASIEKTRERLAASGVADEFPVGAGIATVSLPVKNFPPLDLIETAKRCLSAARSSGSNVVKSLEIY
ncbi:MAG: HDOD domain-containing protein [Planctomycetales bacterium]|nr:HDOD domain-containing protein [Planctomycetales bacterium]